MKRISIRQAISLLTIVVIAVSALGCGNNQKKAAAVARSFLQAYYVDLDFETATRLSSEVSRQAIADQAEMVALNPYAREEVPTITFKTLKIDPEEPNRAVCTYLANRVERTLPLRRFNKLWLVHLPYGTVETGGSDMMELQSGNQGGFAASASGPVTHKKRKRN